MPEERWPELLAEQLRGFGGALGAVRDSLDASARINYRPLEKLLLPPPWHRGRVILIGDAAHATTPHLASGAGLAVEDALVLGECLDVRAWRSSDALQRFAARRYERCRMVVENSVRLGELEMQPRAGAGAGGVAARLDDGAGRADLSSALQLRHDLDMGGMPELIDRRHRFQLDSRHRPAGGHRARRSPDCTTPRRRRARRFWQARAPAPRRPGAAGRTPAASNALELLRAPAAGGTGRASRPRSA